MLVLTLPDGGRYGVAASLGMERAIRELAIVNWSTNDDVLKRMALGIEDLLLDLKAEHSVAVEFDDVDVIASRCLDVSKVHLR